MNNNNENKNTQKANSMFAKIGKVTKELVKDAAEVTTNISGIVRDVKEIATSASSAIKTVATAPVVCEMKESDDDKKPNNYHDFTEDVNRLYDIAETIISATFKENCGYDKSEYAPRRNCAYIAENVKVALSSTDDTFRMIIKKIKEGYADKMILDFSMTLTSDGMTATIAPGDKMDLARDYSYEHEYQIDGPLMNAINEVMALVELYGCKYSK